MREEVGSGDYVPYLKLIEQLSVISKKSNDVFLRQSLAAISMIANSTCEEKLPSGLLWRVMLLVLDFSGKRPDALQSTK